MSTKIKIKAESSLETPGRQRERLRQSSEDQGVLCFAEGLEEMRGR